MVWVDTEQMDGFLCERLLHKKGRRSFHKTGVCKLSKNGESIGEISPHLNWSIRNGTEYLRTSVFSKNPENFLFIKEVDRPYHYLNGQHPIRTAKESQGKIRTKGDRDKNKKQWDELENTLYAHLGTIDLQEVLCPYSWFNIFDFGEKKADCDILKKFGYLIKEKDGICTISKNKTEVPLSELPEWFERHIYGLIRPDGSHFTIEYVRQKYYIKSWGRSTDEGKAISNTEKFQSSSKIRFAHTPYPVQWEMCRIMREDEKFANIPKECDTKHGKKRVD